MSSDVQPLVLWRVSRSAMEERQKCPRARYYAYHAPLKNGEEGNGIALIGGKYAAEFGQALHTAMAKVLVNKALNPSVLEEAADYLSKAIDTSYPNDPKDSHFRREQHDLLTSLIRHWTH